MTDGLHVLDLNNMTLSQQGYRQAVTDLHFRGHPYEDSNGVMLELIGYTYMIDPTNPWFSFMERKLSPSFIAKELFWYVNGDKADASIGETAKVWKSVIDADGEAVSNYGYQAFTMQRLGHAIGLLGIEPETRRAIIYFGENEHVTRHEYKKDQPCANSIQFLIRDGTLHTVVSQRSQDLIYGVAGDAVFFSFLSLLASKILDVSLGLIDQQCGSFHRYPKHKQMVESLLNPTPYHLDWKTELMTKKEALNIVLTKDTSGPFMTWLKDTYIG